jgi:hypothetical protein
MRQSIRAITFCFTLLTASELARAAEWVSVTDCDQDRTPVTTERKP